MIAIETKYLPATNTKPTRIVASANGHRFVMSASSADTYSGDSGSGFKSARCVAQLLADKMGWGPLGDGGGTKAGYVFCFRDKGAK